MRIDKFLKNSRIIKRRTVANEACDSQRITVNGRVVKASYNVSVGDIVEVAFGSRTLKFRVLSINENANKQTACEQFEIIEE